MEGAEANLHENYDASTNLYSRFSLKSKKTITSRYSSWPRTLYGFSLARTSLGLEVASLLGSLCFVAGLFATQFRVEDTLLETEQLEEELHGFGSRLTGFV